MRNTSIFWTIIGHHLTQVCLFPVGTASAQCYPPTHGLSIGLFTGEELDGTRTCGDIVPTSLKCWWGMPHFTSPIYEFKLCFKAFFIAFS